MKSSAMAFMLLCFCALGCSQVDPGGVSDYYIYNNSDYVLFLDQYDRSQVSSLIFATNGTATLIRHDSTIGWNPVPSTSFRSITLYLVTNTNILTNIGAFPFYSNVVTAYIQKPVSNALWARLVTDTNEYGFNVYGLFISNRDLCMTGTNVTN